jgi:hypothetical protein
MYRTCVLFLAVFVACLTTSPTRAENQITLDSVTSPKPGSLKGSGTCTADDGYAISSIQFHVAPVGGGLLRKTACTRGEKWMSKKLISDLSEVDTYEVWAEMIVLDIMTGDKITFASTRVLKKANGK